MAHRRSAAGGEGTARTGGILGVALPRILAWRDRRPVGRGEIERAQEAILRGLLERLSSTRRGRELGLGAVAKARGSMLRRFRELPVEHYADIARHVEAVSRGERDVLFPGRAVALAQTSGTTSAEGAGERYVPLSRECLAGHAAGGASALSRLVDVAGGSCFGGRMLMLGGSTSLERNRHGIPCGDLSGIAVSRIPWFLSRLYEPGRNLALEPDWNRKIAGIARRLERADVRLVGGIPSWCQILFQEVCRLRGVGSLREAWPAMEAFVHGGVSIDPYLPMLSEHLSADTWMMEVYPASEAFLAVGSRPWRLREGRAPDLELLSGGCVHFDFLRDDLADRPDLAVGAHELEPGALYRVLLTTPGGLVRHQIGDLVEGRGPGLVRFGGRVKGRISVFGEHVEGARLSEAIAEAALVTDSVVTEWHVAPVMPAPGDPRGRHEWWVEFRRPPADPARFEAVLDDVLQRTVLDYQAHRAGDVQLLSPRLRQLRTGAFSSALARRGKLGGQHKVPTAWPDRSWAELLSIVDGEQT